MRLDVPVTDADFEAALEESLAGRLISDTGLPASIRDSLDALSDNPPEVAIDNIRAAWEQLKRERPEDFTD
jgi:hypothetical protein